MANQFLRSMAQITWSGTRRCLLGSHCMKLPLGISVSYCSGPVKWTSMQAYAIQGQLIDSWAQCLFKVSD
jgi:hypothetical protein